MKHHAILLGLLTLTLSLTATYAKESSKEANDRCLRCHGLKTLSVRDTVLGGIRNLSVSPQIFERSIHGKLTCNRCHEEGYGSWPHSIGRASVGKLKCTNCHDDPKLGLKPLFSGIQKEFDQSIHAQKLGDKFTCFSCHDPHAFQRQKTVTESKIEAANAMCLNCHDSEKRFSGLTSRSLPVLEIAHGWLPNTTLHWKHVRCVDCHSSYDAPNASHNILPKSQALNKCETCHSQNSVLMAKLYKHEHKESKQRLGFVNGTLMNDAYVIGSTRNPLLDTLSVIIFVLAAIGVSGHGVLRFRSWRNKVAAENYEDKKNDVTDAHDEETEL